MNDYMLTILVKKELDEKARVQLLESIKKRFSELKKEDLWGVRDLAYPIKHQDKAYYAHYEFSALADSISSIDKALKVEEDILRYLLVRSK